MSHLKYASTPGFGEVALQETHYSQAVRVPAGDVITISGQGGWDPKSTPADPLPSDLNTEITQAFDNVDLALKHGGAPRGMNSVYKLVVYYAPISEDALKFTVENLQKWFPDHCPLLTAIGIEKLALETMHIEIEAWAHLG